MASKRILSLDVLRGLTVALMIIVNNPGSGAFRFDFLRHSEWNGCTPTDLVFPFFLFCVGASMYFSLRKYTQGLCWPLVRKILVRGVLIWVVGILVGKFPFYHFVKGEWISWDHLRFLGVFPRIALCYVASSFAVLLLKRTSRILMLALLLMASYEAVVYLFGDDTLLGYVGARIDLFLFGDSHVYHGYRGPGGERVAFDPEGLLSTLTAMCNTLLGFLAARYAHLNSRDGFLRLGAMASAGFILALSLNTVCPINKPVWSATYVIYTVSIALTVWMLLHYVLDEREQKPVWCRFFEIFGSNALFSYVLSTCLIKLLVMFRVGESSIYGWWYGVLADATVPVLASLLVPVGVVLAVGCMLYPLYRHHIYIRL